MYWDATGSRVIVVPPRGLRAIIDTKTWRAMEIGPSSGGAPFSTDSDGHLIASSGERYSVCELAPSASPRMALEPVKCTFKSGVPQKPTISLSPDGALVAATTVTSDAANRLVVWDRVTGNTVLAIDGDHLTFESHPIVFSSSGNQLAATAESARRLTSWLITYGSGKERILKRRTTIALPFDAHDLAISSDGRLLAARERLGAVHIWDAESGALIKVLSQNPFSELGAFSEGASCFRVARRLPPH
jgi:WD40 repeat protein